MASERVRHKPLSGIRFRLMIWSGSSATCFAGTAQTPLVTATVDGTATLAVNTDFSVAYDNNINAGNTAKITVTGTSFTGTFTLPSTIKPATP